MSRAPATAGRFTAVATVVILCFWIAVPSHSAALPGGGRSAFAPWGWLASASRRVVELWQSLPSALAAVGDKGVEIDPLGGR